jgi:tRNA (cytidine/uridine-2'-O-)-methyltransferase
MRYRPDSFLLFGKESTGIPQEILDRYPDTSVRIPMKEGVISMNLSDCVSIVLYEALRQEGFAGLS